MGEAHVSRKVSKMETAGTEEGGEGRTYSVTAHAASVAGLRGSPLSLAALAPGDVQLRPVGSKTQALRKVTV